METFEKKLFEDVLNSAVSRLTERITQRCQGAEQASLALQHNPEGEGIWLSKFIENFFQDNLLDSTAGATFILQALERRKLSGQYQGTVGEIIQQMAREAFAELVRQKTLESLEYIQAHGGAL